MNITLTELLPLLQKAVAKGYGLGVLNRSATLEADTDIACLELLGDIYSRVKKQEYKP